MATRSEFAASIKAKYPQYQGVDDSTLVERMLEKYPQYRDRVTDDPPADRPSSMPGREAQGAFGEGPDQGPQKSALFPNAVQVEGRGLVPAAKRVGMMGLDVLDAPTRALAKTRGMEMSDPNAYLLRPEAQVAIAEQRKGADEYNRTADPDMTPEQHYTQMRLRGVGDMPDEAVEALYRIPSDPMVALAGLAKLGAAGLKTLEAAVPGISKAVSAARGWSGRSAERLSGVPLETLEAYGDPAKRAMMKEQFGQEAEIGKEFLEKFRDPDQYLTEGPKLREISKDLPPVSTKSAVDAMEGALPKPVEGFAPNEIGAFTDVERAANAKAQSNIDFIRGGAKPEDLDVSVSRAGVRATDAEIEAAAKGAQASKDAKAAAQATRAQASNQSKAAKAAGEAGTTKKALQEITKEIEGSPRYGRVIRDGKIVDLRPQRGVLATEAEDALVQARDAATKAREAATDARAKVAVGEISKADYAAAKSTAEAAEANLELLTVAQKLHSGAPLKQVAGELSRQGKSVEQIRDILTRARDRSNSIVQPKSDVSFNAYWDKRKRLDSDIDFGKASDNLVDRVNKAGRSEMMKVMEEVAANTNHPEFKELMKSYSRKAQLVDDLKAYIGQTKGANNRKIQQFFDHLFGKNSQHKQDLVAEMDRVMGTNTLERARAAQQAQQIGHDGTASLFSMHNTGAMGAGQQWLGRIGFLWSSPKLASRVTLPAFAKLERMAKNLDSFPPRAQKLVAAIERADNPAKSAALVNQLARILEEESNVLPFRMKDAAESDNTETTRYTRK